MDRTLRVGQIWRHYKGADYEIVALGRWELDQTLVVVYRKRDSLSLDDVWVRSREQFLSFVDENGYVPRFELILGDAE